MVTNFAGRVLLVEDEEFTRSLLLDGLVRVGVEARAVGTSAEALELLAEFDPHVVVSDLNLGTGPSGAALLSRVAEEHPWVGLLALARATGGKATGGLVVGYVQRDGKLAMNAALSAKRANAVAQYLRAHGVKAKLNTRGDGALGPQDAARKAVVTLRYTS